MLGAWRRYTVDEQYLRSQGGVVPDAKQPREQRVSEDFVHDMLLMDKMWRVSFAV